MRLNKGIEMSRAPSDMSPIKKDIAARNRLQDDLMELSFSTMGTDEEDAAKNDEQILSVMQALYDIQMFREGWESDTSYDHNGWIHLGTTVPVKQQLEQNAQTFKDLVNTCLLSYSASSRQRAEAYLKEIQALYDASHAAINAMADQKLSSLGSTERNIHQQKHLDNKEIVEKIAIDFQAAKQRIAGLYEELKGYQSSEKLTDRDEAAFLREIVLDKIGVEIDYIKQLEKQQERALPHTGLSFLEQEKKTLPMQGEIKKVARTYAQHLLYSGQLEGGTRSRYNSPPRPYVESTRRKEKLKRQRDEAPETEASEKSQLLVEIKRIKGLIHNMTENLTNEIPKVVFSKGIKIYKRNTLLSLSRKLYVSEKSSLVELRRCVKTFETELAKCQSDAKLRQGSMRKDCRKLIDGLAKELKSETHVFKKPKL